MKPDILGYKKSQKLMLRYLPT